MKSGQLFPYVYLTYASLLQFTVILLTRIKINLTRPRTKHPMKFWLDANHQSFEATAERWLPKTFNAKKQAMATRSNLPTGKAEHAACNSHLKPLHQGIHPLLQQKAKGLQLSCGLLRCPFCTAAANGSAAQAESEPCHVSHIHTSATQPLIKRSPAASLNDFISHLNTNESSCMQPLHILLHLDSTVVRFPFRLDPSDPP